MKLNRSQWEDIGRYSLSTRMSLLMCCSPDLSGSNVYIPAADSGMIITRIIVAVFSVYACRGVLYNVFLFNFGQINWSRVSVTSTGHILGANTPTLFPQPISPH